jgi:hypothetical protein
MTEGFFRKYAPEGYEPISAGAHFNPAATVGFLLLNI